MFDHRNYLALLLGRPAEFVAIRNLWRRKGVMALVEVDTLDMRDAASVEAAIQRTIAELDESQTPLFQDRLHLFLDFPYLKFQGAIQAAGRPSHPVTACFELARRCRLQAVPVTNLEQPPVHQDAVRAVIAEDGRGVAIRVGWSCEGLWDLVRSLKVQPPMVDLIIDLGEPVQDWPHTAERVWHILKDLPAITRWRTLTVAGGSFPKSLGKFEPNTWHQLPRVEWLVWQFVIRMPGVKRRPSFGDFAVSHPVPAKRGGRARNVAQVRYSAGDTFLINRGEVRDNRHAKTWELCDQLVHHRSEYAGPNFSFGDLEISRLAAKQRMPGGFAEPRMLGDSHHMEMAAEQVTGAA